MSLDRLIDIVFSEDPQILIKNKSMLFVEINKLNIKKHYKAQFLERILDMAKVSKNPKTRESYIRAYYRIYKNNITVDGREGSIIIDITKKCNKDCLHCYSKYIGKQKEMPDDILNSIIDYAKTNYKHIFLTGGEPTVDPRIFSITKKNPDIIFFMFTNAALIDEDFAKRMVALGNLIPIVGIDGASEKVHDSLKGAGSYKQVMKAIEHLNKHNVSWGYISLVTETNAHEVLSWDFIKDNIKRGAFLARYIEYLPVGPNPLKNLILSGKTYFFMEERKKEILESKIIYLQKITQPKCTGLTHFNVDGDIKNCLCFHYAKYNVKDGNLNDLIQKTRKEWESANWNGECPIYSNPVGLKKHLEALGWKSISAEPDQFLKDTDVTKKVMASYKKFLELKKETSK